MFNTKIVVYHYFERFVECCILEIVYLSLIFWFGIRPVRTTFLLIITVGCRSVRKNRKVEIIPDTFVENIYCSPMTYNLERDIMR